MTSPNETLPADGSAVRGREDAVSSAEAGARGWKRGVRRLLMRMSVYI